MRVWRAVKDYLKVGDRHWAVRRRGTIAITIFACAMIWRGLEPGIDPSVANATIAQMVTLIGLTWCAYVGAATAETVMQRRTAEPAPPPEAPR